MHRPQQCIKLRLNLNNYFLLSISVIQRTNFENYEKNLHCRNLNISYFVRTLKRSIMHLNEMQRITRSLKYTVCPKSNRYFISNNEKQLISSYLQLNVQIHRFLCQWIWHFVVIGLLLAPVYAKASYTTDFAMSKFQDRSINFFGLIQIRINRKLHHINSRKR